ncbi:type II toxin-antitoxin system ParD family antitoxin [Microvirga sp. VF16]|uniref:type II toxin-antitoxin system ParD family antitoxin n=1 Tax=Microvirga sp. VF16 TaxID=2807101 RepID=UPI00193E8D2A|nr:type II toxin-antitoxin system ParD family antitoxin [Microvirga sp. VF16]QRM28507.1 type II toxin-antitoxin system ParD family antitoxin [Microvirga sp. VF16]
MPAKFVRSVSLTRELTAFIDEKIGTGHYRSASEVVRAALRLLAEQDRRVEPSHHQQNKNNRDGQEVTSV